MKRFYVYAVMVDGVPRYIGKGSRRDTHRWDRFNDHMRAMRRLIRSVAEGLDPPQGDKNVQHIARPLAHAWLDGAIIAEHVLADGLTIDEAFERERLEIAACPKGQLWNISPGGQGWDSESAKAARAKASAARDGPRSEVHKASISRGVKASWEKRRERYGQNGRTVIQLKQRS